MLNLIFIISCSIGIVVCIGAKDKYGFWFNHYTVMNLFWNFILFISFYCTWYYGIGIKVYLILFGGLLFFNSTIVFVPNYGKRFLNIKHRYYFDLRKRRKIEFIFFLMLVPFIKELYDEATSGMQLWAIRQAMATDESRSYGSFTALYNFLTPLSVVLSVTAYYRYYTHTKRYSNKFTLLYSLIITILFSLIDGGGRNILINWLFYYLIFMVLYFNKHFRNLINDNGKINIYLLSIPIIAGVILTIARGSFDFATRNEEMSFLFFMRRAYTYFIPLFDYYLKHPIEANFTANNTLGISTFENIFILINYPFRKLFGTSSYLFNYQPVNSITQDAVRINANLIINNQVSMYFRFLRDWGYLGICIGPVLLASFFDFLYRYALKDAFNFLLYAYTMASLLYSFSDLPFSDRRYLIVSILFLFFKKFILTKRKFA